MIFFSNDIFYSLFQLINILLNFYFILFYYYFIKYFIKIIKLIILFFHNILFS